MNPIHTLLEGVQKNKQAIMVNAEGGFHVQDLGPVQNGRFSFLFVGYGEMFDRQFTGVFTMLRPDDKDSNYNLEYGFLLGDRSNYYDLDAATIVKFLQTGVLPDPL